MANDVSDGIEDTLNLIVSTSERSGNMEEELKHTIFETVSTLRNLFVKLKDRGDRKSVSIRKLEMQVSEMKAELAGCNGNNTKVHGMPSVDINPEPAGMTARRMALPGGGERKLYSEALRGEKNLIDSN